MSRLAWRWFVVVVCGLAGGLSAHCQVVTPNGGEVLRVGSQVTIQWRIRVAHPQENWDLWYSTKGANGPWIPIKMNMPVSQTSLVWTVPNTPSTTVRFRIRQDNTKYDTYDISDRDTTIAPSLSANRSEVSITTGGTQTLALDLGAKSAKNGYWMAGSVTGTEPGIPRGHVLMPLKYDVYTAYTVAAPNSAVLSSSRGVLDENGRGETTFRVPKGLPAVALGVSIHHACITYTGTKILGASNPVSVKLVR
jgi:hypothetical protein